MTATSQALPESDAVRADSLRDSIVALLLMTVLQRGMGFARGLALCRVLPPDQLGQWDLALGFLELTAPIVVLGIPGSFGRFVEHYRQRGLLRTFVRRTAVATALLALLGIAVFHFNPELISLLVFGSTAQRNTPEWMGFALVAMVGYFFSSSLLTSLRRSRTVQRLEFLNSALFAVLAIGLTCVWRADAASVVLAYALAATTAAALAAGALRRVWQGLGPDSMTISHRALWSRLVPFAMSVWGTNWLANAFEMADRYMIVHTSGWPAEEALAVIGNYHSARVLPLLLVSLTGSLATIMLPYLSHDWEHGRRDSVAAQLSLTCKVLAIVLTLAAAGILVMAPFLFGTVLAHKYAAGLAVLPGTLACSIWYGLARVAQKYLWCAQRVVLAALAWSGGLATNVALNLLLLPRCGLAGVVWATAAGNLAALILVLLFSRLAGMRFSRGTAALLALPLITFLPGVAALITACLIALWASVSVQVFTASEKQLLRAFAARYRGRIGWPRAADTPALRSLNVARRPTS